MSKEPKLNWAKFMPSSEPTYMCTSILAFACEDTIIFIDTNTGKQNLYRALGDNVADGVSCIAGHRHYNCFAVAEMGFKPRIFIYSYPDFGTLQTISKEDAMGQYAQIRFSQTEYLVALTKYPAYKLKMWNYRLGVLMSAVDTGVIDENLELRLNNFHPFLISQYAKGTARFMLWEAHSSIDRTFLINRPVVVPFLSRNHPISVLFGIDGVPYLVSDFGDLHSVVISTGTTKLLWEWQTSKTSTTFACTYKGGFLIFGYQNELRHVKKVDGTYTCLWSLDSENCIMFMGSFNNFEFATMLDIHGAVWVLKDKPEGRSLHPLGDMHRSVKYFELIYPHVEYVVVLTDCNSLQLLKVKSGELVSKIDGLTDINIMRSHPEYPVLITGHVNSVITIFSYFNSNNPTPLYKFCIGASALNSIKFGSDKNCFVVKDIHEHVFIMKGITTGLDIWTHFTLENIILDYTFCDIEAVFRFLFLTTKGPQSRRLITREVLIVAVSKKDLSVSKRYVKLNQIFRSVTPLLTKGDPEKFFAIPRESRQIYFMDLKENNVHTISKFSTAHQVKDFSIYIDHRNIVSFGQDGIVCVYDLSTKRLDLVFFGSHRLHGGIKKACVSPDKRYCIIFTKSGCLRCLQNEIFNINETLVPIPKFESVFGSKELERSHIYEAKTWLSAQGERKVQVEFNKFKNVKKKIIADFSVVKTKVEDLLNKNEAAEELDQLPVYRFNLNMEWEHSVKDLAKEARQREETLLRAYIEDQNRITKWIINFTWDKMEVKGQKVCGIFSTIFCENFPLILKKNYDEDIKQIELLRSIEVFIDDHDRLYPWMPRWQVTRISQRPTFPAMNVDPEIRPSEQLSADRLITLQKVASRNALSGTSTYLFIKPNDYRYEQLEVVSFMQMFIQQMLAQNDMLELKRYFNKIFKELIKLKKDQVSYVKERNERLREIQSEIIILARIKGTTDIKPPTPIIDPVYNSFEMPESIIKVEEREVSVKPYISPSRQKILDAIAYQEELRRLALMADDFRDRALMAMMDGVLERRWEDEIKKDPPLPDCVRTNKDPFEYTKEDVKSVQEYEEKLKFVKSERERYNTMLHEEQTRTQGIQDEQIIKFNTKCGETFLLKVKVDAAIRQEELCFLRAALFSAERSKFKELESEILGRAEQKKLLIKELVQFNEDLDKMLQECRARYEQLQARDKSLDKQFKSHFGEQAPAFIVDQAYKIFKKRPKWPQRAWATYSILTEMSIRIGQKNSAKKGIALPEECYDFLHLIDSIENFNLAPNTIDHRLWDLLCRMRRHKMESEFRVKACGAQLAEAEASLNAFTREIQAVKTSIGSLDKEMQDLKQKCREHLENRYVQLVMPMGQVEVDLGGKTTDFNGCLLLSNTDVEDINAIIKRAGRRKLSAMRRLALFRRKIIFKEWEHKVYQMTLQDMKKFVTYIDNVKVTIEMQEWLRKMKAGKRDDLSNEALRRLINGKVAHLQNMLAEMDTKIEEFHKKIEEKEVQNKILDKKISNINIEVATKNLQRDVFMEEKELRERKERMDAIVERGRLVRKIQSNHTHILELVTMLELQRLRTYPTLAAPKSFCP